MKKFVLLLVFLLLLPLVSSGKTNVLKLRASNHSEFLRIVLEGDLSAIEAARVYQRQKNILVKFPDQSFSIEKEKIEVPFSKNDDNSIMFYPGEFRGLKVFRLKHPDRLVIDVYLQKKQKRVGRTLPPAQEKKPPPPFFAMPDVRKNRRASKVSTVIIDPGHGGYDKGLTKGRYIEKNVVLDIARKLNNLINRGAFKGYLTRGSDGFMTLLERAEFANAKGPEIFLSIHIGTRKNMVIYLPVITDDASDVVKLYLSNKGQEEHIQKTMTLLNAMKEAITVEFGEDMVSIQPLPYSILSKTESASLMIELPSFDNVVYTEEVKTKMANALYKGLYIYEEIKTN
ncbi:N-acetylmuramoyl-L-alanine amidase AmiC precursor [bacterium BMS3Abin09]|nr:N-acetylmuramoyl-L-alanine amidase AmiC precursor [bacterium BMS3Abin09]GBE41305.1 N-acetylmuramoyl-L-alanine amidase AmiC precursor [bacterium BMS3Bbin09]HDH34268.1 N-acetylmuramoyl-L-alanine amidase [Nitrospirota bacterium]HDN94673.1 N-acetylmuramoyl-L-alanine amidase [Nitrospirota bacterium]HDO67364.1 N-acetylmuramoyl-L-alanine amidase [Nitrospirota bacterium]